MTYSVFGGTLNGKPYQCVGVTLWHNGIDQSSTEYNLRMWRDVTVAVVRMRGKQGARDVTNSPHTYTLVDLWLQAVDGEG